MLSVSGTLVEALNSFEPLPNECVTLSVSPLNSYSAGPRLIPGQRTPLRMQYPQDGRPRSHFMCCFLQTPHARDGPLFTMAECCRMEVESS